MAGFAPFNISRLPRIVFGAGTVASLPDEARAFGPRALIVTGARSFMETPHWTRLVDDMVEKDMSWDQAAVGGEPSPALVDGLVAAHKDGGFDSVIGIGGGSALDAAKAVAGLLRTGNSVMDYLEGVGPERPYQGPALPFIAVPTTAGTGSEATKNAVLSRQGDDGFKKSFRHETLVARVALVDPDLLRSCPRGVLAANGMDAFTQLLESLVSTRSNPMTEALAWSGLRAFRDGFFDAWEGEGEAAVEGRAKMAYASLMSGLCLAQTGLGSVHGLASPLGAFFPIPHGVVCGTLVAEATDINIKALMERDPLSPALHTYAKVAALLNGETDRDRALESLVRLLRHWTGLLELPLLGAYGVEESQIPKIVANARGSSMKTNPIVLSDGEIAGLVRRRL